jgi:hypothetical protein
VVELLPPVALAISFVDRINHRDLDGLVTLMSEHHRLEVFDEKPVVGRDANSAAWRGYFDAFPRYVVYPQRISEKDGVVAILGHTTGSHLGLSDDEERRLTLIWVAHAADGYVTRWRLVEDTAQNRAAYRLAVE